MRYAKRHANSDAKVALKKGHLGTETNTVTRLLMDHGWTPDLSQFFSFFSTNLVECDICGMNGLKSNV